MTSPEELEKVNAGLTPGVQIEDHPDVIRAQRALALAGQQRRAEGKARLLDRIESDFKYHAPKPGQPEKYEDIRTLAKTLARRLVELCPEGRELSTALTHLETAVMHAIAAIARHE